jgi:DNA polymerase
LKRPELLKTDEDIADAIRMVKAENYAVIKQRYGDVLGVVGDLCRSMIVPAPGRRFIIGDFSAIEARVLAFLAGDADKLERFKQFDLGLGRDLYCLTAEQVLGIANVPVKSLERQLGKVFELALGFGMGDEKLLETIRKYRIPGTEGITLADATRWVQAWRAANPLVVKYWAGLNAAAKGAVRRPGTTFECRSVSFEMKDGVLLMHMPSGRDLSYPAPVLKGPIGKSELTFDDMESGRRRGRRMYGGAWAENVTQAVTRDLLVEGMKRLRGAGYELVMHTHDEAVAEMVQGQGSAEEFKHAGHGEGV